MSKVSKTLIDRIIEQDRRSYTSMSAKEINTLLAPIFTSGNLDRLAADVSGVILEEVIDAAIEQCSGLLDDLKDSKVRKALKDVLIRSCNSGEFNTTQTISNSLSHLFSALHGRVADRLAFLISDARADKSASRFLLTDKS